MAAKKTKADDRTAAQKSMDQHREAMDKPAEVPPATEFSTSGAPVQIVSDVDPGHPAVDNDPRANTTVAQNRIDFNDPDLEPAKAVEENLRKQAGE